MKRINVRFERDKGRDDIDVLFTASEVDGQVAALNPSMFLRVSRYDIVNLQKVERFDFSVTGTLRIELADGQETWASRRFVPAVKERLKKGA